MDDERFWKKVDKSGRCWLWTGWKNKGYGMVYRGGGDILAHRHAWKLVYGKIPAGKYVCHRCDVKNCVRPSHLFLGTQQDNMDDMRRKGRDNNVRGSAVGTSKLHEHDIPKIRAMRLKKITFREIAARFSVSIPTIEKIVYGEHWKHA